ncbi:MAG: magnesium transporter CorA family protein [Anaerolineae bacterium]
MIRSLVASAAESGDFTVRRNLETDQLEKALSEKCLLWIDCVSPEPEEISWIAAQFGVNPVIVEDLRRDDHRPVLLVYSNYLFLSMIEPRIKLNRVEGREVHCLVTDTCFITVRPADAESVDDAYDRAAQSADIWHSGVAYCFYLTAQHLTDTYYPLLDRISNQLNEREEYLLNDGVINDTARRPVYAIKKQLINLRQMVAPQREVFSNVIGEKRLTENSDTRDLFRHLYERLLRVYDIIDSQRDLSSNVLDMMQNQESRKLVDAVSRLTIFSMIFLPLTFFTGLFQLNFAQIADPIVLPVNGTLLFVLVMGAMLYIFRRRGWF